ncbi:hypothetical protein ACQ4PT_069498 [Festuca glaucescens]
MVEETRGGTKKPRATNYNQQEDVALCYAWMNVSLDASVGTDQSKEKFWARIEDYYNNTVTVPITRTQGSLGHRWGAILEQCNCWSGCVDQVRTNPPSGVPVTEYDTVIQDLYKLRNKKNGGKAFNLHHCYKELVGNEKWVRKYWELTRAKTLQRSFAWRFAVLISFLRPPMVTGDTYATSCGKTGNYTANSTYQSNLHAATTYLANEASFSGGNGFARTAYGEAPDVVYALVICRGDTPDNVTCYECLSSASLEAPTLCPDHKDATLFYDGCTVRFSDQDFLSSWDNAPEVVLNNTNTVKPAAAARRFDMLVSTLMEKISEHAAARYAPDKKIATGEAVFDGDDPQMKIYGLAQCTPDMTSSGCGKCLRGAMDKMALRMRGSLGQGGRGEVQLTIRGVPVLYR